MAKDKLVLDEDRNGLYRIVWHLADEGDYGATLGEMRYTVRDLAKATSEDWDHIAATVALGQTVGVQRDSDGYYWDSHTQARAALRAAQLVLKTKASKPWPEWATQAAAAGWKPPKGWTP